MTAILACPAVTVLVEFCLSVLSCMGPTGEKNNGKNPMTNLYLNWQTEGRGAGQIQSD